MLDGRQLAITGGTWLKIFWLLRGRVISDGIRPEKVAAVDVGGFGLVRSFLPFRGRCHLSGVCCESGACAAFSEVVPRRLLSRLVNRSWMKLGCKQRKDVG